MTTSAAQRFGVYVAAKDPTSTITLRNQFVADVNRRLRDLKRLVWTSVVTNDALGLTLESQGPRVLRAAGPNEFAFLRGQDKIDAFMEWLREQERQGILEIVPATGIATVEEPWSNTYIRSSYQRGLAQAGRDLEKLPIGFPQQTGINSAFFQPFHADRVGMIYSRTFTQLEGITATMDAHIANELALGLARGVGTETMAKAINAKIDSIGIVRSRMIARTEVVQTFNEAALNEYERAEVVTGREIKAKWITALDERVRDRHIVRHGKIFDNEVARGLLGEPNCRCVLQAHIDQKAFEDVRKQDIQDRRTLAKKFLGKSRKQRGIR